jgi:NCS1 nucleoside transporter family
MRAADLGPVAPEDQTQSPLDLFLIFAGANVVATTFQTGATLAAAYGADAALSLIAVGACLGSALIATLARLGPRLGVPSIVAARAPLGRGGAAGVALLLYVTNFAWFAINNVIAASVIARAFDVPGGERVWGVLLGVLATTIVARGPAAVRRADRLAVPLMLAVGLFLTWALSRQPTTVTAWAPTTPLPIWRGFDVVIGYQVSWLLMFADYSRYTRSESRVAASVFLGLCLTSLWFMPVGYLAARIAGSMDPGVMVEAAGLGTAGIVLLALATITTNFVNVYMSTLAWKSLVPRAADQVSVWSIGLIGTALGLFSTAWLERYADFMLFLGAVLVPVGGVLLAHFVILRHRPRVADLYGAAPSFRERFRASGLAAWGAGTLAYFLAGSWGSTWLALTVAIVVHLVLERLIVPAPGDRVPSRGR